MKVMITGIGGFVGSYLVKALLATGAEIHGTLLPEESFTDKNVHLHRLDLMDPDAVKTLLLEINPDQIYHLAGQSSVGLSWKAAALTVGVNVIGTIHLLEALRESDRLCRVLIIGSSDQYGAVRPEDCPLKETQPCCPQSPYATSKKAQEEIAAQYAKAFHMDIVMVRAFNHIGAGQRKGFVIADFASQIAEIEKGLREPILCVGNLNAERDFSDVRDIVRAYVLLMQKGRTGEIYNVGSGNPYRVGVLLEKLVQLSAVQIKVEQDPARMRPSDIPVIVCSNDKLKADTGWHPEYSIDETLQSIISYWRSVTGSRERL